MNIKFGKKGKNAPRAIFLIVILNSGHEYFIIFSQGLNKIP